MGCIYRRKKKLEDGTSIEIGPYWIKYYRNGRPIFESAETSSRTEANSKLRQKEGDIARGLPLTQRATRILVDELLEDVKNDYRVNSRKTVRDIEGRCRNHISPFFGRIRAASVTTANILAFTLARQEAGASNAEINRELAVLKRAYSLAIKGGKLLHKPHVPMLKEDNVRTGFFERDQFERVRQHLPGYLQAIVTFAYITGWRTRSEILTMKWSQVDFKAGIVRLNPGATKNDEGRVFPFKRSEELTAILKDQRSKTEALQREQGMICPLVFHHAGRPIRDYRKAWANACEAAGVPGRIPHDFRRTAVRNLERAGVSRSVAMKLTGHKTEAVYRRYAIVSERDLAEGVEKLQAFTVTTTRNREQLNLQSSTNTNQR